MKTYKAGELREDMLVVPVHILEGFALVPVEPTDAMNAAGVKEAGEFHHCRADAVDDIYKAMLAAAQQGAKSHE